MADHHTEHLKLNPFLTTKELSSVSSVSMPASLLKSTISPTALTANPSPEPSVPLPPSFPQLDSNTPLRFDLPIMTSSHQRLMTSPPPTSASLSAPITPSTPSTTSQSRIEGQLLSARRLLLHNDSPNPPDSTTSPAPPPPPPPNRPEVLPTTLLPTQPARGPTASNLPSQQALTSTMTPPIPYYPPWYFHNLLPSFILQPSSLLAFSVPTSTIPLPRPVPTLPVPFSLETISNSGFKPP